MTKQQLAHASKLLMELAEIFHQASLNAVTETVIEEANVIQPLVEVEGVVIADVPTTEPVEEDAEDLSSMTIQQLRALAKSNGLSTKGTKKDLISRITESNEVVDIEEPSIEEPVENEIEEVIEDEVIEDEEDVEVIEEGEEMSHMEVIQAELEDMSLDELKEILESVDLPTKGKKQALISRILEAVENGVLEFEEEVDEEYEADEIDEDLDVEEADFEEIVEEDEEDEVIEDEEDEDEDEIEDDLSPREATQQEVEEQILEDYENGDLTDKQIAKFLDEYFNGKFKPLNKKRALNKYIEIHCDLVDVDGDVMPMKEAYFVDEETIFCCGSEVNELDNGNLYCEVCGQEYETE